MRRWTVLLVSHDSEAPHSISVSERLLRVAAGAFTVLVLVAMIGVGTIIARIGRIGAVRAPQVVVAAQPVATSVDSLRTRVGELRSVIDSIDLVDDSLGRITGSAAADSSILRRLMSRLPGFLRPIPAARSGQVHLPRQADATAAAASADSLLRHARGVSAKLRALDSARVRDFRGSGGTDVQR